jgi:hypothetical protein
MFGIKPPSGANVPILGQPHTILGWFPIVTIIHNCEEKGVLTLSPECPLACPACGKIMMLKGIQIQVVPGSPTPQIGFQIAELHKAPQPQGEV